MKGEKTIKVGPGSKGYCITRLLKFEDIRKVINSFNTEFEPALSKMRPDLDAFAEKLHKNAIVYVAGDKEVLGFIAFYANDHLTTTAYFMAVLSTARNRKIGKNLLACCIETSKESGMNALKLEVDNCNLSAIDFYKRNGFEFCGAASKESNYMVMKL